MMKVYINIKKNSNLRLHQPFNKRIGLMKRERTHSTLHHFSFGERFDETLMKGYCISCQYIRLSNHQFIGISALIKSAGETAAPSLPVCCCADRQSCRHNGTEYHTRLAKRKGRSDIRPACCPTGRQGKAYHIDDKKRSAYTAGTLTGFWKQKSHSSLGRFLHAPLTLMLKTPQ